MRLCILVLLGFSIQVDAQRIPLPHGTVFGEKPDTMIMERAEMLPKLMGNKTSLSTTLSGVVKRVTKVKGGWFELADSKGEIIAAHFKNYKINLPKAIKGRGVIVEGVAVRQFIADDSQHFAGDSVIQQSFNKRKSRKRALVTFEVSGLMVDK